MPCLAIITPEPLVPLLLSILTVNCLAFVSNSPNQPVNGTSAICCLISGIGNLYAVRTSGLT
ncbi:MAG: hypothetical protein ACKOQS_23330 [Dolichospermum sp.]